jgi:hypothetical protein
MPLRCFCRLVSESKFGFGNSFAKHLNMQEARSHGRPTDLKAAGCTPHLDAPIWQLFVARWARGLRETRFVVVCKNTTIRIFTMVLADTRIIPTNGRNIPCSTLGHTGLWV